VTDAVLGLSLCVSLPVQAEDVRCCGRHCDLAALVVVATLLPFDFPIPSVFITADSVVK